MPGRALDHPVPASRRPCFTRHDRPGVTVLLRRPQVRRPKVLDRCARRPLALALCVVVLLVRPLRHGYQDTRST